MKIDLYVTYYELVHLQSSVPINNKIFWVLDEFLSIIEEEIDKEVLKNDWWNLARTAPHFRCSHRSCNRCKLLYSVDFRTRHCRVCTRRQLGLPRAVRLFGNERRIKIVDTFIQGVHLPGRIVNFLIIEKTIDKVKEMCYTLITIKKGNESYDNLYYAL